jgi:hypothetical protein
MNKYEKARSKKLKARGLTKWETLKESSKEKIMRRNEEYMMYGEGRDVNKNTLYTEEECRIIRTGRYKGAKVIGKYIADLLGRTLHAIMNKRYFLRKGK